MSVTTERVEPCSVTSSVPTTNRFSTSYGHQCLVLSRDERRIDMLSRMATAGGWETTSVSNLGSAWRTYWGSKFALAIVDSETAAEHTAELREFAEHMSSQPHTLLIVCGTPDAIEEEMWARQNGAWMYLPGVGPEADLSTICGEALGIAKKLAQSTSSRQRV